MNNQLIIHEIFPRVQKFQVELPNEHNVSEIHLTLNENNQFCDVFGFDGNLIIENLKIPTFVDDFIEDSELYTKYKWLIPYLEAIHNYTDTNGMGIEW